LFLSPAGQNSVIDLFKRYASEGGWKILAADSAMIASTAVGMGLTYPIHSYGPHDIPWFTGRVLINLSHLYSIMGGGLFGTPLYLNPKCLVLSVVCNIAYWMPHAKE
jgi:hypothetical protein